MPFYSCGRLGASKERPLECSGIGGIAPRGFSAASDSLSFFCAWRCGLCGKSWSLRFPARLLRSSKQDPRRGLPARRGSLGVTGRYVAADGNVALSRSLFAPATCQSEEARARCDQAREPRRIAVTDGRSFFLIGRGTPSLPSRCRRRAVSQARSALQSTSLRPFRAFPLQRTEGVVQSDSARIAPLSPSAAHE